MTEECKQHLATCASRRREDQPQPGSPCSVGGSLPFFQQAVVPARRAARVTPDLLCWLGEEPAPLHGLPPGVLTPRSSLQALMPGRSYR